MESLYRSFQMTDDERHIYQQALDKWGIEAQVMMAIEECAELITALCHLYRGRRTNIIEEIADVIIMIEQLSLIFGEEEIDKAKQIKLARLKEMILSS